MALRYSTRCKARVLSKPSTRLTDLAVRALIRTPPCTRDASMKQGSFAMWTAFPPADYYDPLRLPLDHSATSQGSPGYRRRIASHPRTGWGRGGSLQFPGQPSDRSASHTPRGSWAPAPGSLMPSMAFAIKVHARLPFGPAHTGFLSRRRRLRFMLRTDQLPPPKPTRGVVAPLRPRPLDRRREPRYQGPWRLPGPDFHRLAALNLSPGYVMATSQCPRRPGCWTHTST